jgi:hypothetical protein
VREGHRIRAQASRHEPDRASSAQSIGGAKHLVPRQFGALTHDLIEVARTFIMQYVEHLIFDGNFFVMCHLLKSEMSCCVDTALSVPADNLA